MLTRKEELIRIRSIFIYDLKMRTIERGVLLRPDENDGIDFTRDGILVVEDGVVRFVGTVREAATRVHGLKLEGNTGVLSEGGNIIPRTGAIIMPPTISTHSHIFQPPGVPGRLIEEVDGKFSGWLPTTLQTETKVRNEPERARGMARRKFESYIAHGITGAIEYTTSSEQAVRNVLEVAEQMGLKDRVKVGYVCMDQNVDFIDGVKLETTVEEALEATERLLKDYPGQIVVIDRFPIACSSELRRKLVELAGKYGARYETHVDESEGEAGIHQGIYNQRIMSTLFADGVFESGMNVGLAHGIHTSPREMDMIAEAIQNGCKVNLHACPNSNAQLGSHVTTRDLHTPFPLRQWEQAGANVSLGLDNGAGRGRSIAAEALWERGRPHVDSMRQASVGEAWAELRRILKETGNVREALRAAAKRWGTDVFETYTPPYVELLRMMTINGAKALGVNDGLQVGRKANYIVVDSQQTVPPNVEKASGVAIENAQDPNRITRVVVDGLTVKS